MPLHPQAEMILQALRSMNLPPVESLTPGEARRMSSEQRATLPPGPDARVTDHQAEGPAGNVHVRLYRPPGPPDGPLPVLVWYHGGGFVLGSVPDSDRDCRLLSTLSGVAVASVEYRLAPEHRFPAAADDGYAAASWISQHATELGLDASRLAVGGDSAGGNLAAVVSLMARDRGAPRIAFQLLVYPVADLFSFDTRSYAENAEGYFLTRNTMEWFRDHYTPDPAARKDPYASPLHAKDCRFLPAALVITAEFDPLRDEGEAYAAKLEKARVPVTLSRYDGMIHGFFSMNAFIDLGMSAMNEAAAALRTALGRAPRKSPP